MRNDAPEPCSVRLCSEDDVAGKRAIEPLDTGFAILRMTDQLREHRVEVDAHL
jgi:hypothetical protein